MPLSTYMLAEQQHAREQQHALMRALQQLPNPLLPANQLGGTPGGGPTPPLPQPPCPLYELQHQRHHQQQHAHQQVQLPAGVPPLQPAQHHHPLAAALPAALAQLRLPPVPSISSWVPTNTTAALPHQVIHARPPQGVAESLPPGVPSAPCVGLGASESAPELAEVRSQ